jgi:integrase
VLFVLLTGLRQEALLNLTLDALDVAGARLRASAKYGLKQDLPVNRHLLEEIDRLARAPGLPSRLGPRVPVPQWRSADRTTLRRTERAAEAALPVGCSADHRAA